MTDDTARARVTEDYDIVWEDAEGNPVAPAVAALAADEPGLDVFDGARAEYNECKEVRRLLGYLWTATGYRGNLAVRDLFTEDDPIVADIERLAIFPEGADHDR